MTEVSAEGYATGTEIECPPAGQTVRFLETAADTDGEYTRAELRLDVPSNSQGPVEHVHPKQDETLEVVSGRLGTKLDGEVAILEEGEEMTFPKGRPHKYWNAGEGELVLVGTISPAFDTELFMRIVYGLSRTGWTTGSGIPLNPLRIAALLDAFDDHLYVAHLPMWLQKLGATALGPIAHAAGYEVDVDVGVRQ